MTKIKNLLEEVKNIITELKTNTNLTGQVKTDLEKRIDHILDKNNPRHTNLTQDLEIDLKELAEIEKALGAEKIAQTKKQQELENKTKQLEQDINQKDQQIKEKDEAIGQKITKELIEKLEKIEPGQVDETKINELKTLLEKIAKKEVKTDLTEIAKTVEEVGKKVAEVKSPPNYWSMAASILGGLAFLTTIYLALTRKQTTQPNRD